MRCSESLAGRGRTWALDYLALNQHTKTSHILFFVLSASSIMFLSKCPQPKVRYCYAIPCHTDVHTLTCQSLLVGPGAGCRSPLASRHALLCGTTFPKMRLFRHQPAGPDSHAAIFGSRYFNKLHGDIPGFLKLEVQTPQFLC